MSYWYERITKKHIIVLVIAVLCAMQINVMRVGASFITGAIATASREIYDWLAVDYPITHVEIVPFVHFELEDGCIEWLGFSTCEQVQFKDWSKMLVEPEALSMTLWNISNTNTMSSTALPAMSMTRSFTDVGTVSFGGQLILAQKSRVNFPSATPADLEAAIMIPNLAKIASDSNMAELKSTDVSKVSVKSLFGDSTGPIGGNGIVYFGLDGGKMQIMNVPAKGTAWLKHTSEPFKRYGTKGLYYFTSIGDNSQRCWDPGCAAGCDWSTTCEPVPYGFHGIVLPSGSFYWPSLAFTLTHKPIIPWNYKEWTGDELEKRWPISVFDPETFVSTSFMIKAEEPEASLEKFPDVKTWTWEVQGLTPTCGGPAALILGKDCDAAPGYVNVDFASSIVASKFTKALYISLPRTEDGVPAMGIKPKIYSEVISGLSLDFLQAWQMNTRVGNSYYPLFWVSKRPATIDWASSPRSKFTPEVQDYGAGCVVMYIMALLLWAVFSGLSLLLLLYASSCIEYVQNVSKRYEEINYI